MNDTVPSAADSSAATVSLDVLYPDRLAGVNEAMARATGSGHYERAYAAVPSTHFTTLDQLESLPILRKSDFIDMQRLDAPFGGLMASSSRPDYLFVSPGPIHEPGFVTPGFWRMEAAMRAAGFSAGDVVHNTFSYHLTPGAWIFDSGSRALGCSTIPAGNAPLELQLHAIAQYRATCYAGTPDFLKKLIEAYALAELGAFPIKCGLVSGGPFTAGLQQYYEQAGIRVSQCYATAELGSIAYDVAGCAGMLIDEGIVVEIVDPESGRAMPFGQTGEVVVTTLREDYPLIRFGTGDLSAFVTDDAARAAPALVGWLGRSDQALKLRGMFVRPQQLEAVRARIDGLERIRLVIDRANEQDTAVLFCAFADDAVPAEPERSAQAIADQMRRTCHLNISVSVVDRDSLADDGRLIEDLRPVPS